MQDRRTQWSLWLAGGILLAGCSFDHARRYEERIEVVDRSSLRDVSATPAEPRLVLLGEVLFAPGSSEPDAAADETLATLVERLRAEPDPYLVFRGHADASGEEGVNVELAAARANAVRHRLSEAAGLPLARSTIEAYGSAAPVADNDTAAGRSRNRRVEVLLIRE